MSSLVVKMPHIRVLVPVLPAPLQIRLPVVPGRAVTDGPSTWAPVSHMGDLDGVSASWFQLGRHLGSQSVDKRCLSPALLFPYNSAFQYTHTYTQKSFHKKCTSYQSVWVVFQALAPDCNFPFTQTLEGSCDGSRNWAPATHKGDLDYISQFLVSAFGD